MKKIKHIAAILAVILSMTVSVDDIFFLCINIESAGIPAHSNSSDVTHHHHFSISDHFCQKYSVSDSGPEFTPGDQSPLYNQPFADMFLSSIWQPPQKTI